VFCIVRDTVNLQEAHPMKIYTDSIRNRLEQLINEICNAHVQVYYDRLREFKHYCDITPVLASCLAQLPQASYDFGVDWRDLPDRWPSGEAGHAYRWDAINQAVDGWSDKKDLIFAQLLVPTREGYARFTEMFVIPLYNYLVHQIEFSSITLYLLLRYKCWAEWFEVKRLRQIYSDEGETGLDRDLRRFLFESGIDYPFSQPHVPRGQVDIVAGLETGDPLVSEVKVWDSAKNYKVDRVCDGLRQVMYYATKYGKDRGYVVVFNLDPEPLVFEGETDTDRWPARTERGGRTYYFIAIDIIPEYVKPVSKRDKGKPVKTNEVQLAELWARLEESPT
jgi:hypothetical protein